MKVALCLSGQARSIKENFPNIKEKFLDSNDVDVFAHTWFDDTNVEKRFSNRPQFDSDGFENKATLKKETPDIIQKLYSPKKCIIEKQKPFIREDLAFREKPVSGDHPDNPFPNRWYIRPQWFFSMCYSIMRCNNLKKEYEQANGFTYDCVIRSRFDMKFIQDAVDFSIVPMDKMYAMRHSHCHYSYHDTFAFSNSENMDYYANLFNCVKDYYEAGIEFCPEIMLGWHLVNGPFEMMQLNYGFEIVR